MKTLLVVALVIITEALYGMVALYPHHVQRYHATMSNLRALILAEDAGSSPVGDSGSAEGDAGSGDAGGSDAGSAGADTGGPGADTSGGDAGNENAGSQIVNEPEQASQPNEEIQLNAESQPQEQSPAEEQANQVVSEDAALTPPAESLTTQESEAIAGAGSLQDTAALSPRVVDQIQQENDQVAQAETPQEQVPLLLDLAGRNVSELHDFLARDNFSDISFLTRHVSDQIDQALTQVGSLDQAHRGNLKQELATFAQKAEPVLRAEQLVVPEKMEQDFEIIRSKLLNISEIQ